jgi:putative holliday junction resolvase
LVDSNSFENPLNLTYLIMYQKMKPELTTRTDTEETKILGLDFGTKRVGVAISDLSHTLARELDIFDRKSFWRQLSSLLSHENVVTIVLGLPLNMNGEHTDKTKEALEFKSELEQKTKLHVELQDERLSSVFASQILQTGERLDSLAAQMILQLYLDRQKHVEV